MTFSSLDGAEFPAKRGRDKLVRKFTSSASLRVLQFLLLLLETLYDLVSASSRISQNRRPDHAEGRIL